MRGTLPRMSDFPQLAFDRALASAGLARDVLAFDRQTLRKFDADGRMHVERCNISKANVCPYLGREIPKYQELGLKPNEIYQLYRDPVELERGASTFARLQLLMIHTGVNAETPKTEVTVGTVGSDVVFEAPYLTASIAVWTAEAIKLIESKKQAQLSCSYRYRADMTPGVTPEGVAYHGVMRDIMGNHVALVEEGRAGPDVYVSDSLPLELSTMYKRPKLVAAITAALAGAQIAVTDETKLALDAAMEQAEDEDLSDEEKAKRAKDAKGVQPGPREGERGASVASDSVTPAAMDAAIKGAGFITKADAERLASDAASTAVARVNALHKARADVLPLVGVVAMDSAEEVYAFALKTAGVAFDGVTGVPALSVLVEQVKAAKSAKAAPAKQSPALAMDAANAAAAAIPGLGRFQVG